jgi:hypothetical protein
MTSTGAESGRADAGMALSRQYLRELREGTILTAGLALGSLLLLFTGAPEDLWSALLVLGLVWCFYGPAALIMSGLARVNPDGLVLAAIGLFTIKILVVGSLIMTIGLPSWLRPWSAGVVALLSVIGWQALEFRAHAKARVPLYVAAAESRNPLKRTEG